MNTAQQRLADDQEFLASLKATRGKTNTTLSQLQSKRQVRECAH